MTKTTQYFKNVTEWTNFMSMILYPTLLFYPSKKYFKWIEKTFPSSL